MRLEPFEDGTYLFKAWSFSRRHGRSYRCRVNPETGFVWCNCADFQFRRATLGPCYGCPEEMLCKHLRRAVRTVAKVERRRLALAA